MESQNPLPPALPVRPQPAEYPPALPRFVMYPQTSGLAVAALVTGVIGIGLIAVILGHVARSNIRKSNGMLTGDGMAITGLVFGYFWLSISILITLVYLLFFAVIIAGAASGGLE